MNDQQKAERRELIRRNKEMLAAQDVRRAFLRTELMRHKHSTTAVAWALARLVTRERTLIYRLSDHGAATVLAELLGEKHTPDKVAADAPASRHPMLLWATVCAVYESGLTKDVWRRPANSRTETAAYLTHLVGLGYVPCETEQLMIDGDPTGTSTDSGDTSGDVDQPDGNISDTDEPDDSDDEEPDPVDRSK